MPLDPDAQAIADAVSQMPALHEMGLDGAREFTALADFPAETEIADVHEITVPTPGGNLTARLYHPNPHALLPILLYMHGGGWATGGLWTADETCRKLAAQASCVVVNLDYRLAPAPKFPVPFEDPYNTALWLSEHGAEIGGDPTRLALGGDSAGATLSAAVAVHARDNDGPAITALLLAYPATEYAVERPSWIENADAPMLCTKDVLWFWDIYLRDDADRTDPRATPSNSESLAGLPPAFVLTAETDPLRDDAESFGAALQDAGNHVVAKRYPGVFHGFFTMPMLTRSKTAIADAARFLSRRFAQRPPV